MKIRVLVLSTILLTALSASAGIYRVCTGGRNQQIEQENQRYTQANNQLSKERNVVHEQYQKDILDCQEKYVGSQDNKAYFACTNAASRKEQLGILEIAKKQSDEDTAHKNRVDEIGTMCSLQPARTLIPCQDQIDAENYQYAEGNLKLRIERNNAQNQHEKEIIDCQEKNVANNDQAAYNACTNAAYKKLQIAILEIQKKQTDLDTMHKNQMADIQTNCGNSAENCSKSVFRAPDDGNVPTATMDTKSLFDAMNQCLSDKIKYYSAPTIRTYTGTIAYNPGVVSYDPSYLSKQSNYNQVFLLARSLAQSVLDQRELIYSVKKSPADLAVEQATLIGFLTRCAYDNGYVSGDPRQEFASFLSQSKNGSGNEAQCEFFAHFNMPLIPYTIAMD